MTKEEKELRTCYHWTEWERKAKELEQTNNNLLDVINNQDVKIADLEKENAELKADNDARKYAMVMSEKVEKQLRKENAELKNVERMALYSKLSDQLAQAKEMIKEFVEWANWQGANCPNFKDIQSKAEQFLKADVGTKNYEEQDKILKTKLL